MYGPDRQAELSPDRYAEVLGRYQIASYKLCLQKDSNKAQGSCLGGKGWGQGEEGGGAVIAYVIWCINVCLHHRKQLGCTYPILLYMESSQDHHRLCLAHLGKMFCTPRKPNNTAHVCKVFHPPSPRLSLPSSCLFCPVVLQLDCPHQPSS